MVTERKHVIPKQQPQHHAFVKFPQVPVPVPSQVDLNSTLERQSPKPHTTDRVPRSARSLFHTVVGILVG